MSAYKLEKALFQLQICISIGDISAITKNTDLYLLIEMSVFQMQIYICSNWVTIQTGCHTDELEDPCADQAYVFNLGQGQN